MNCNLLFVNRKKNRLTAKKIIKEKGLTSCYKDKSEEIFKNEDMLMSCHKSYIYVHIFQSCENINLTKEISQSFYGQ